MSPYLPKPHRPFPPSSPLLSKTEGKKGASERIWIKVGADGIDPIGRAICKELPCPIRGTGAFTDPGFNVRDGPSRPFSSKS